MKLKDFTEIVINITSAFWVLNVTSFILGLEDTHIGGKYKYIKHKLKKK